MQVGLIRIEVHCGSAHFQRVLAGDDGTGKHGEPTGAFARSVLLAGFDDGAVVIGKVAGCRSRDVCRVGWDLQDTGDRGEAEDGHGSADAHDRWGMHGRCPFMVRLHPLPYRVSTFLSSIRVSNRADLSRLRTAHHWSESPTSPPPAAPTHAARRFAPRVEH